MPPKKLGMPPTKRAKTRKSAAVTPPTEEPTQQHEVFSDEEESDGEEELGEYEESEGEEEELAVGGEGPAGTISRMVVKNFMNHEHLKMELKPGINFIIGKNGSGKSAMCHAAQVALGATARETERGTSMAGFVRHGQPYCEVRLDIRNAPRDDAFEHSTYGDTITVVRRVHAAGGGNKYELRDAAGKLVSRKRDDLQRMLDHYNIQVNNPCSVLGQDDSKKLATGSDEYKYDFYLRATGLQTVLDQLKAARNAMKQIDDILERQGKEVPRHEDEVAKFQKEYDDASELFSLKDKLQRYTHELAWSQVRDKRCEIKEHQQMVLEQKSSVQKELDVIEKLNAEIAEIKPKFEEGKKQMAEFTDKLAENQKKTQMLKRAEDKAKKEVKRKNKEIEAKKNRIKDREKDIADNVENVKRIKEAPLENEKAKQMQAVRDKLNGVLAENQAVQRDFKKLNEEQEEVEADVESFNRDSDRHKENMQELDSTVRRAKQQLNWAQSNAGNADARFGNELVKLMAAIDQNERKFSVKPIGPVGKYINMKEERWTDAVENAIGNVPLRTVLVHTYQDEQLCLQLVKKQGINPRAINFNRMKIDGASYRHTGQLKMDRFPANNKGFVSVLDMIEVTNPAVENFLFDKQIYTQLLCPSRAECMDIAYNGERNVKSCYDLEATRYYRSGNSQHQVPYRKGGTNLLVADNSQAIAQNQRIWEEAKAKVTEERQRFANIERGYQRDGKAPQVRLSYLKKQIALNERKQGANGRKMGDLEDQLANFANEDDEEVARANEVGELEAASQLLAEENENLASQIAESQQEYQQLVQEAQGAEREKDEFLSQQEGNFEDMQLQVSADMEKYVSQIGKKEHKVNQSQRKLKEARVKVAEYEKMCKALQREEASFIEVAQKICEQDEEIESSMTTAALNKCRQSIQIRLDKEARKAGGRTLDAIEDDLAKANRALEHAMRSMVHVKKTQQMVSRGFNARKKKYRNFRKSTAHNARKMFNRHLGKKGHMGDLQFAHKNRTLGIKVTLMSDSGTGREVTNTKTLSGGEKSFTTLALLLALGTVTQVPFAVFDEVDVYMDDVNRRITLQALYDEAKQQKGRRQYCVLTPQDLTGIKTDKDTQILKMKDPDRLS